MTTGSAVEWRIGNLSHWCAEVHGECIHSPEFYNPSFSNMALYPKGINATEEHLVVHLCGVKDSFSGEHSICCSDGSLLFSKQQAKAEGKKDVLELPPGPKFDDVLSRIRESDDFIILRLRGKNRMNHERCMLTTINFFKISLEINSRWIEKMKSNETKATCLINFSPRLYDNLELFTCSENNAVHFMISPPTRFKDPFAVEICMRLTKSDGTVDRCVKEHVFRDKSEWTFPDPIQKERFVGKEISLLLCLKTKNLIQSPPFKNEDYRNISIEINNPFWMSEKSPSTDPVTVTKDDSVLVLTKELKCLYQEQEFSDVQLKCDNISFPVHKAILSARSPVFKTLLSSDMKERASSEVGIGGLDPSTLGLFLTYLYTGTIEEELQVENAIKLYYAADKYQVPSLKRECSKFLRSNVSLSNVCDILSHADKHQDNQLIAVAQEFIVDNYNAVLRSTEWDTLKRNEPVLVAETLTLFGTEDRVDRKPHR